MFKAYIQSLNEGLKKDGLKLPNLLTQFRLLFSVVPGLMLIFGPSGDNFRMIIIIVFLLIASTDMFDGLVARTFHLESEYGRLLDPVADMSFGFFTLMALCFSNPLAIVLMLLTVLRQLHLFWLFNKSKSVSNLAVVLSGKAKTVAVIVAVVFMLIPQGFVWQGFTTSAIVIAGVLIIVSWLDYWRKYDNSI